MAESKPIQEVIEAAVQQALDARLPELRAEIVRQVAAALPEPEPASAPAGNASAQLNSATNSVQSATSQADILGALLEGAFNFAGRAALFVMRGGAANGWQGRGFSDNNVVKQLAVDASGGLAARAIRDRMPVSAAAAEFSSEMVSRAGNPSGGNCVVLPLLVRDKVPALLYADGGTGDGASLDSSALEVLVRTSGLWLEAVASRRAGPAPAPEKIAEPAIAPVEKVVEKPIPPEPPVPEPPVQPAERVQESGKMAAAAAVSEPPPEPAPAPAPAAARSAAAPVSIAPGDEELHKKAKRFAKLLVDEIRLYNQAKVAEGRQRRDLYDRLKDDIDKSRATYDKRYGSTPAATGDYFSQELIRILADNDAALLGSNFPRS